MTKLLGTKLTHRDIRNLDGFYGNVLDNIEIEVEIYIAEYLGCAEDTENDILGHIAYEFGDDVNLAVEDVYD